MDSAVQNSISQGPEFSDGYSRIKHSIAYVLNLKEYLATSTNFPFFSKGLWVLLMGSIGWRLSFNHQIKVDNNKIRLLWKLLRCCLKIIYLRLPYYVEGQIGTDKLFCSYLRVEISNGLLGQFALKREDLILGCKK